MITLWHNPRCSKSRQALALLQEAGAEVTIRRYLEDPPTLAELRDVHAALGHPPVVEMMRSKEPEFKAAGLSKTDDDAILLAAMADYPKLIERPVAIKGDTAILGRPPENVLTLI